MAVANDKPATKTIDINPKDSKTSNKKKKKPPHKEKGPDLVVSDELNNSVCRIANLSEIVDEKFHVSNTNSNKVKSLLSDIDYKCTVPFTREMDHRVFPIGFQTNMLQPIPTYSFSQLTSIYQKPMVRVRHHDRRKRSGRKAKNRKSISGETVINNT